MFGVGKSEKKEAKILLSFAKKLLSKKILKKINSIKDLEEKIHLLKYSLKAALDKKILGIRKKIKLLKKEKKDVFFISIKVNLLNLKIKYFDITFHKRDFKMIMKLFKEIEKEVKNV